jgi:hypothetical protein
MCALIAVLLPTACGGSHDATHDATDARDTPADVAVAPDAAPPHDPKPLADAVEPISAVAPGPAARPEDGSAFTASAASASGGFSDRLPRRNVATGCVDLALERLGATQRDDGSWAAHDSALDLATTGAALLCFSGFGESHRAGSYTETVKSGLRRLTESQPAESKPESWDGSDARLGTALSVAAVWEIHGLTASRIVRPRAQRDLDAVLAALRAGRFRTDDDPVVSTAACLMLDAAARGGLSLPDDWREIATRAISAGPDEARWAAPALVRRLVLSPDRKHVDDAAGRALVARLIERLPQLRDLEELWITGVAASNVGGDAWEAWRDVAKARVIDTQRTARDDEERGTWDPVGERATRAGRTYATAVADLAVEVYFGYTYALGAHQPKPDR